VAVFFLLLAGTLIKSLIDFVTHPKLVLNLLPFCNGPVINTGWCVTLDWF